MARKQHQIRWPFTSMQPGDCVAYEGRPYIRRALRRLSNVQVHHPDKHFAVKYLRADKVLITRVSTAEEEIRELPPRIRQPRAPHAPGPLQSLHLGETVTFDVTFIPEQGPVIGEQALSYARSKGWKVWVHPDDTDNRRLVAVTRVQ